MCLVLQPFILCYMGEVLFQSNLNLSRYVFNSSWFNQSSAYRDKVKIFLTRLNRPMKINVAGLFDMSLSTFVIVSKIQSKYYTIHI